MIYVIDQQKAFWDLISVFEELGLLSHVMLIGSWAEYIYQFHMQSGFQANLRTRDTDFLYMNLNKPKGRNIDITAKLKEKGFLFTTDYQTGITKFVKEDLLELSFLTRAFGEGKQVYEIPSLKIKAEGLRSINMLAEYPMEVNTSAFEIGQDDFVLVVPEPEAYIVQKLLINPERKPMYKKEKDIEGIRGLLPYVNVNRLQEIFNSLTEKQKIAVVQTKKKHFIDFI